VCPILVLRSARIEARVKQRIMRARVSKRGNLLLQDASQHR
jgi:hypothetical protein